MPDSPIIPVFAIVGHPNEGKSSVVATLAEDDQVRISDVPGETLAIRDYPVRVDGQEIIRFVDTPGFQHPQTLWEWMRPRADSGAHLARAFIDAHRHDPGLAPDLELLRPIAAGSGLLYVVDGSRPVRRHDLAEMEILRLSGNPRMAVINPKEDTAEYVEDWKAACARCFNATRTFNALRASYAERIALLESLKAINQDWEPALARAIRAFETDWRRRNGRVAATIGDLLRDCLEHIETRRVFQTGEEAADREALVARYRRAIVENEAKAHAEIRRLFKHHLLHPRLPEQSILREDLFTEKTWQLLGLTRKQTLVAAAALGAGVGVKLDFIFAHLSFGLFTVSGAALGAAAAWLRGENMARVRLKRLHLGGVQLTVGPNQNPQFPFVLLDRALLAYQHTVNWTHARRDTPASLAGGEGLKLGFTAGWNRERRKVCLDFIKALLAGKPERQEQSEHRLLAMLTEVLSEISGRPDRSDPD